jgi:organic radical activating enzyme
VTFENIPLPSHLHDSARIYWMMSEWCNYGCEYCGVPVFLKRSQARGLQNHAFDHYPVDRWLEGFRKFPQSDISLVITGGEPFLDRNNFPAMLAGLLADGRFQIRVYTNLSWNPSDYDAIDKAQIHLNTTFHPSQTSFPDYRRRLHKVRDAGFSLSHVNVILAPENIDIAESALTTLEQDGFPISAGAMLPAGRYMDRTERTNKERDLIRRFSYPLSAFFSITRPVTKGRACFHPAFSFRLHLDGTVNVACIGDKQNLFTDGVPNLPRHAVACPHQQCEGCPEMIRAIVDLPEYGKPLSVFHPAEATREALEYRASRKTGLSAKDEKIFQTIDRHLDALPVVSPREDFVPIQDISPLPQAPPFGFIDKLTGSDVIQALSRDRIYLSGWAASARVGEGIREVSLFVGETKVASINRFHPRPEVVTAFQREDLLQTGWRAFFYLPFLDRGEYPIVARAVTSGGTVGELPPFRVKILE